MKLRRRDPAPRRRVRAGFTLVEVLVALLMMALLTALAWRALDGVLRARDDAQVSVDRASRLATVLVQWEQDLQAVVDTESVPPLAFDGQTLRLTRRSDSGVAIVAWSVRSGRWTRWTAPAIARSGELQEAWMRCLMLQGTEPGHLTLLEGASGWQLYYARGGNWANAQSTGNLVLSPVAPPPPASGGAPAGAGNAPEALKSAPPEGGTPSAPAPGASAAAPPAVQLRDTLPDGVRMVITLDGETLTRDIALGPAGS